MAWNVLCLFAHYIRRHTVKINKILSRLLLTASTAVVMVTSSHAALLGRDINGMAVAGSDASSVFLYDTDRDITWLRDANVNGSMSWFVANTWASGYSIGVFDDWRLPTALNADGSGPCGQANDCVESEIGHLWYAELGNSAGSLTNTGDFLNMQSASVYWFATEYASDDRYAWAFSKNLTVFGSSGYQFAPQKGIQLNAMAVRDGDVLTNQVPEPESLLLALTALGAMALIHRRRAVGTSAVSRPATL